MGLHSAKIPQLPATTQSYQLHIRLSRPICCQIGRLGRFDFPAGRYLYTGSARRNMAARLTRHLQREKPLRWHIDYLLTNLLEFYIQHGILIQCFIYKCFFN